MRKSNYKMNALLKKGTVVACASTMLLTNSNLVFAAESYQPQTAEAVAQTAANAGVTLEDGTVLAEGIYKVPVEMKNMSNLDKNSMAADSMKKEGTLTVKNGQAKLTLTFQTVNVMTCYGNLEKLSYFDSKEDAVSADAENLAHEATVLTYRTDGKYSEFGGQNLQENLKRPADIQFTLPYTDSNYVYVSMVVDIMTALGMTSTEAAIYVDYANAVEVVNKDTLSDKVTEAKAVQADQYTDESFAQLTQELATAETILADASVSQAQVNAQLTALTDALDGLTYKTADYTAVDAALSTVPADLSGYTQESAQKVNAAVEAVVRDKKITEQTAVDKMAADLTQAVSALEKMPEKTPAETPAETVLDKNHLKDGTYSVNIYLWNASQDKASMAASSLLEKAKIVVKDGVYTMHIQTQEMTMGTIQASLQELKVYTDGENYENAVVETRDADGNPTGFSFVLPSTDEFIDVAVNPHVAMMGNMDIAARLKVDYTTLKVADAEATTEDTKNDSTTKLPELSGTNGNTANAAPVGSTLTVTSPGQTGNTATTATTNAPKTGDTTGKSAFLLSILSLSVFTFFKSKRKKPTKLDA